MRYAPPLLACCFLAACAAPSTAPTTRDGPDSTRADSFDEQVAGLERRDGLFSTYLDREKGRVLGVLPAAREDGLLGEFLYLEGLRSGLGSNPVGLDRGQIGRTRYVRVRRMGERVFLEQPNLAFRARSEDESEVRATAESFATSILWATDALATSESGETLFDLTKFIVRDAHGVAGTLRSSGQGSFSLDADRSALITDECLAFPDNLEFEAVLTFASSDPGRHVRSTAPDGTAVSLIQHHSFVRLPPPGYEPRPFDPRSGSFSVGFQDYAAQLDESIDVRFAVRHRLEKYDQRVASSRAKEPIVYYVDRGAPEPVRSALVEGASWWAQAFEAAGYEDAFRVELLPQDAHPLDVRYNVIQWVHRSTRGWSYGNAVSDPRTGEIVKGHVSLGSLRVRQDRLLFEGLAGVERTGSGAPDDPIELALARIRQLAAHEVGHTLGFAHNFSASTNDRASVMDYPAPLVRLDARGELDFSDAYAVGIGAWDEVTVRWLYQDFPPEADAPAELERILTDAPASGLRFLTDADARPAGAADPRANLWDNGEDLVQAFDLSLDVRSRAMTRFGVSNLHAGQPLARLQEVFAPVYFHHRYQLDALVKMIGGVEYDYTVLGSGAQTPARAVPSADQERALIAVLRFLEPETLDVPEPVLELLLPRPPGHGSNRELFTSRTGVVFDALGAAATAAGQAVSGLLQHERCARLIDQHRRDPRMLSLADVLAGFCAAVFRAEPASARLAGIQREVQDVALDGLIGLAGGAHVAGPVRALAEAQLIKLALDLGPRGDETREELAHREASAARIRRFLARSGQDDTPALGPSEAPPGSPIGTGLEACSWGFH